MEDTYSLKLTLKELQYIDDILFKYEGNPLAYVIHSKIAIIMPSSNSNKIVHKIDRKDYNNYNCTINTEI